MSALSVAFGGMRRAARVVLERGPAGLSELRGAGVKGMSPVIIIYRGRNHPFLMTHMECSG